ncbi:hypothetical protein QCA50_014015 [Cerrena zonata]|uniref:Uncharacterized protein n=1 Tax=Cerrena zonata TaxID=2478898 RepID=A0AAW0FUJ6_9APHY
MSEATTPAPSPPITGTSPVALGDFTRLGALPDGGFTGVATAAFLQSITSKLALGIETVYSKQASIAPADAATSYFARYNNGDWIASAQVHPTQGSITGSLWRKITDQVDAGIESKLTGGIKPVADPLTGGAIGYEPIVEGETTLGAKYEYHTACL